MNNTAGEMPKAERVIRFTGFFACYFLNLIACPLNYPRYVIDVNGETYQKKVYLNSTMLNLNKLYLF